MGHPLIGRQADPARVRSRQVAARRTTRS
jgi:hypothetical protein